MKFSLFGSGKSVQNLFLSYFCILVCLHLASCIELPIQQGQDDETETNNVGNKPLTTQNHIYEPKYIKTVRIYAAESSTNPKQYFNPPITLLGQSQSLILEFDQIGHTPKYYQAKIIHCHADWSPSNLLDMEFINEINEFQVNRYELSYRTKTNYLHYKFTVPKVKLSGNYILVIYKNNNQEDRILTRRFMVYESKLNITPEPRVPTQADARDTKQQIDFKVSYTDYNVINPREEFKVVVRQNYRWDNAIQQLKPIQVRDFDHVAEYNFLNGENYFAGLNEYRRFDATSTRFLGFRIGGLNLKDSLTLEVETDQSKGNLPYFRMPDYNGNFIIGRQDSYLPHTESDYIYVKFSLKTPKLTEQVYVVGAFNDWQATPENLMHYDEKKKIYQAEIYLKQGDYNYQYAIKRNEQLDGTYFEGSHQVTENDYDILIYHRPIGTRADKLIGYKRFNTFQAN